MAPSPVRSEGFHEEVHQNFRAGDDDIVTERFERGGCAKLFVGSVPKTADEEDVRPLFEEHGNVLEIAMIRDKKTGQRQGCCFIKYGTSEEADQAIRALHNQCTLPGGVGPIQVRYADGERERLGAVEYKLFVGSMNREATEQEIGEIFSQYGQVEDVYLMRDDRKQSRGCGFVKFSHREMALAAINALSGSYTMRGCEQPLTVRFADPKRPRLGDSRGGPAFGGPGFGPRFQGPGARPGPNFSDPVNDQTQHNAWQAMSPPNLGPSPNAEVYGFGEALHPRPGDLASSRNLGGRGSSAENSSVGAVSSSSILQQGFNQPTPSVTPFDQKVSPLQKPNHLPQQSTTSHSQPQQTSFASVPQTHRPYSHTAFNEQLTASQQQAQLARNTNLQALATVPLALNPNQLPGNPAQQPPAQPQQSPYHLAQMLSQQKQSLQASFSQLQQQMISMQQPNHGPQDYKQQQMMSTQPPNHNPRDYKQQHMMSMQPANHSLQDYKQQQMTSMQQPNNGPRDYKQQQLTSMQPPNHGPRDYKQQQLAGSAQQSATSVPSAAATVDMPSPNTSSATMAVKCVWTEHTSPDGYKYYYNSVTGESKWEKPDELRTYELQQQKATMMPPIQLLPTSQQMQFQAPHQMQYQAPRFTGHQNLQSYSQAQGPTGLGHQASQDWMWKNNMQTGSRGA